MANTGIPLSTSFLQLNSVIADERANSYVTAADFAAYWTNHWNGTLAATMLALTVPQTEMLLVQACRIIETLHFTEPVDPLADYHLVYDSRQQQIRSVKTNYGRPQKYNYFQFLQFPRTLDIYQDGTLYIPYPVQAAQCEQAAYLYTFDTTNVIAGDTDNDRAILHQNCHCIRCGAEWVDVYKLTGYSNLKLAQEE